MVSWDDYEGDTNGGDGDDEDDEGEGEKEIKRKKMTLQKVLSQMDQMDQTNHNAIPIPWNGVGFDYIISNCIFVMLTFYFFGRVIPLCPFSYITHPTKCFPSHPSTPKKLFIFNMNGIMCYFLQSVILQRCHHVRGRNIDISKMGARVGVQIFFLKHSKDIIL
jgi:hypothetical protein